MGCPLVDKLPLELRLQIWEHVVEEKKAFGNSWSSVGYFSEEKQSTSQKFLSKTGRQSILRTSRQIFNEISPLFYHKVCIVIAYSGQTLRWLQQISPRNTACIRHLVIRYHSLLLDYNDEKLVRVRRSAWDAALRCMPALLSLTFDFNEHNDMSRRATPDKYIVANDTVILNELAKSALAWSRIRKPLDNSSIMNFRYRPQRTPSVSIEGRQQQFNHALIALDEDIPSPLQRFFAKRLHTDHDSLDLPVTGLPSGFFAQADYELTNTYAFNGDKAEQVSVVLTYQRLPRRPMKATLHDLEFVLTGLPIKYLRLGSRHIDSSCLQLIPALADQIVTLEPCIYRSEAGAGSQPLGPNLPSLSGALHCGHRNITPP